MSSDAAGLGLLNLLLHATQRAGGKADQISAVEYSKLLQRVKPGSSPDEAAKAIIDTLGDRAEGARKAMDSAPGSPKKGPVGGLSASPRKAGGLAARAKMFADAADDAGAASSQPAIPTSTRPKGGIGKGIGSITMPAMQRAAPLEKAVSSGNWDGPAIYLTYEATQSGILFANYSKTAVPNAIAYAKPGKPIPPFKFETLGGKTELCKNATDKHAYMRGVSMFMKAAKQHSSSVDIKDGAGLFPMSVYIHYNEGNKVAKVASGALTPLDGLDAVACVPQANTDLKGITVLEKALFVQRGDSCGGTAS